VQGLAFDDGDRLWASEFGWNTFDELNLIEKGSNYGWPMIEGPGQDDDYVNPQVVWNTDEASPSGLAYLDGRLWLAALNGERLWRVDVNGKRASKPTDFFVGKYGRLRTVVAAPDGNLWVTTSNHDGRGDPAPLDDRILVIDPG
jgi:glucose/arabinose dehydrogenase